MSEKKLAPIRKNPANMVDFNMDDDLHRAELALSESETASMADWGAPQITARDVAIPKILAMQAMSKPVTDGEAKFGEFRDSLNGVVVGDINNPIEFIPFFMEKVFVVMAEEKGTFRFRKQVPITAANEDHAYEAVGEDGAPEKWFRTQNFYCLSPKEIKDGTAIPFMISFRSSSARAGQKIGTQMFMKNPKAGKSPAGAVMELSGAKTSNDKGTFIVMDARWKRDSTRPEVAEAFEWVKTIRAGAVKVDHSDIEQEESARFRQTVPTESTEF